MSDPDSLGRYDLNAICLLQDRAFYPFAVQSDGEQERLLAGDLPSGTGYCTSKGHPYDSEKPVTPESQSLLLQDQLHGDAD